jgi:hypothetical protein
VLIVTTTHEEQGQARHEQPLRDEDEPARDVGCLRPGRNGRAVKKGEPADDPNDSDLGKGEKLPASEPANRCYSDFTLAHTPNPI